MGPVGTEMKNVILDFKSKAGGRQEHQGGMETDIEHLLWGQITCHVMLPVVLPTIGLYNEGSQCSERLSY